MAGRTSSRYSLVTFGMSGYFIRLPSPALCAMTKASRSDSRANCASGWLALSCLTPSSRFLRYMPPYWAWMFGSVMPWGGVWSAPSGCTPRHTLRLSCNRPQVPPLLSSAYASGLNPDSRRMRAAMKSAPNPLDWAARSTGLGLFGHLDDAGLAGGLSAHGHGRDKPHQQTDHEHDDRADDQQRQTGARHRGHDRRLGRHHGTGHSPNDPLRRSHRGTGAGTDCSPCSAASG